MPDIGRLRVSVVEDGGNGVNESKYGYCEGDDLDEREYNEYKQLCSENDGTCNMLEVKVKDFVECGIRVV